MGGVWHLVKECDADPEIVLLDMLEIWGVTGADDLLGRWGALLEIVEDVVSTTERARRRGVRPD